MKVDHHSPTSLNLFCVSPALYVLQKFYNERTPMGAAAHRGTAVEAGAIAALSEDPDPVDLALAKYASITGLTTDPKREKMGGNIPAMVEMVTKEWAKYSKKEWSTQGKCIWHPDDLEAPILGFYDLHIPDENLTIDLKTSDKMPGAVKISHARQVSFYAGGGNGGARVTYVTPAQCRTYEVENVDFHRNALKHIAQRVEKFLSISDTRDGLLEHTAPDLEHYYWSSDVARALAYKYWGV